ncbi:MAG: glutamate-5-semialdehyde dehydrogenase [Chloroflexi bacterium]|nr:MAG: glutamate-5-semialdehyde dehydrogenase [Chloroflexota bacterium]
MKLTYQELINKGTAARQAARRLAFLSTFVKNAALEAIATALETEQGAILAANEQDLADGQAAGLSQAMLDRLLLTPSRLDGMASDVRNVAALPDPTGEVFDMRTLPNGLQVGKKRVPIGVLGVIYESRPNVTVDIAALALKSGNAVILRGGKESRRSNQALAGLVQRAITQAGVPEGAVQLIETPDRELVRDMLRANEYIDMIIPRGGAGLHHFAIENATIPVITGGIGVCHTYVDETADLDKALEIVYNAKVQRPTVCNALDTLLVHRNVAAAFLPAVARRWREAGVELRCDPAALAILGDGDGVRPASDDDFGKEFLSLVASVRIVDSLDEALDHIYKYGTGHSEAIVTESYHSAQRFLNEVDAAAVFVNASTRFTDGGQFGLGAEVAISTQRLHARGPMGLKELTTYKWIIRGDGHVRP